MRAKSMFTTIRLMEDGQLKDRSALSPSRIKRDGWYVFTDQSGLLCPSLESIVLRYAAARPDIDIFYGDEAVDKEGISVSDTYYCKPCFDETQLIAQDYIGWPLVVRGRALELLGRFEGDVSTAFTYDLLLRAMSEGLAVERIPEILVVRRSAPQRASSGDRLRALQRWLLRSQADCEVVSGRIEGTFRLRRKFDDFPHVTLLIPTCQALCKVGGNEAIGKPHILNMLASICETDWPMDRLTVLIGDDVANGALYGQREWPFELRRVDTARLPDESFNYAHKMNCLWRAAESEYVVLMNDDLVARSGDWLEALMTFAFSENVGGVGARLLYPDDKIQHAGMAGGVMGSCTHVFIGLPALAGTYQNWADVQRECSMVTGAVFATRKSLLEQINGFDESFPLDFNDVDMCLRMRILGYRIVYTPHAELTHYESASRGRRHQPGEAIALFMERWKDYLPNDPAYHPRLVRDTPITAPMLRYDDWWV